MDAVALLPFYSRVGENNANYGVPEHRDVNKMTKFYSQGIMKRIRIRIYLTLGPWPPREKREKERRKIIIEN